MSVGIGIICLTLAVLLRFVAGSAPRLVLALVLVASASIGGAAAQGINSAVNSAVRATNQASAAALGGSATVALTLVCAFLVGHALKGGKGRAGSAVAVHGGGHGGGHSRSGGKYGPASGVVLAAAAALPLLAASTPGQFGSILTGILTALSKVVGSVGHLFGV
jgi:hypothetical protein